MSGRFRLLFYFSIVQPGTINLVRNDMMKLMYQLFVTLF